MEIEPDGAEELALPEELVRALEGAPAAKELFDALAPSYRNQWIAWIEDVKPEVTRAERLREAVRQIASGVKQPR